MPSASPSLLGPKLDSAAQSSLFSKCLSTCVLKTRSNIARLADEPKAAGTAKDGNFFSDPEPFFSIANWTSSFHTGMALLALELTRDFELLRQLNRLKDVYHDKVFVHGMDTMHDLGFLYTPYSVGLYRLTGDSGHLRTGLKAADELAKRLCLPGDYIQAWGRMDNCPPNFRGLSIIDCMMNLPLLFWASSQTGAPHHASVAKTHADFTLAHYIRPDDSVCHAYRCDPKTGTPTGPFNDCGFDVNSHWARGTTWAVYGFAIAYRHTGDMRYLDASVRLATKFISLLDDEVIPVWDFRLPDEAPRIRDSSAAAIMACGLQELLRHCPDRKDFAEAEAALLEKLCRDYINHDPSCPGILKDGQTGTGPRLGNAYTSWGDYFLMEALARRQNGIQAYW